MKEKISITQLEYTTKIRNIKFDSNGIDPNIL